MDLSSPEIRTKDGFMLFLKTYPYIPRTILGEIPVPQEPGIITSVEMYRYFFHVKDMTYYPYYKILVFYYQSSGTSSRLKVLADAELENGDKLFAKYGSVPQKPEDGFQSSGIKADTCLSKLTKKIESLGKDWLNVSKADELLKAMARTK